MTDFHLPLEEGGYYHIYNRANGSDNLFRAEEDYLHFLQLYQKYILPVADTFAWVLMPNHFHLLVRIKDRMVYEYSKEDFKNSAANAAGAPPANPRAGAGGLAEVGGRDHNIISFDDIKWKTIPLNSSAFAAGDPDDVKGKKRKPANPTRHFGHLCNAYAKYINKKYRRHGSLFQRPFSRKAVDNDHYLRQLVLYIHNNAVHHGFVSATKEYLWSSYHQYLSSAPTYLHKSETIGWFGSLTGFMAAHDQYAVDNDLKSWLEDH